MKSIKIVFPLEPSASEQQRAIAQDIKRIRAQHGKVYRTYVMQNSHLYTLSTTSKDIHLSLGQLLSEIQRSMCLLLDEEFTKSSELLLTGEGDSKTIMVTRSMTGESFTVYHLSPAN